MKVRVTGKVRSSGDLTKVYSHARYQVCTDKCDREQTLTHRLTKMLTDRRTDGQTDGQTDRRTSSIHKPELLCNPANRNYCQQLYNNCIATLTQEIPGLRNLNATDITHKATYRKYMQFYIYMYHLSNNCVTSI